MLIALISLVYFLLPAGFSNMFASLSARLFPNLNYPLDFYKTIFGKRMLGNHKTFRGLIAGIIGGMLISLIQWGLYETDFFRKISFIDYTNNHWLLVGFLLGFGAIFGDALKSLIKRQIGIKPGDSFIPFDQIDWIIGAVIFISPVYSVPALDFAILTVLYFVIHITVRYAGYLIKLNNEKL